MRSTFAAGALAALLLSGAAIVPALATPTFPAAVKAGAPPAEAQDQDRDFLQDAADNPLRSPQNKARDKWRHPAQSLTFWGIRPGDVILELDPGGGYWTEVLAAFAKSTDGRYIAAWPEAADPAQADETKRNEDRFLARFANQAAWGKLDAVSFGPTSGPLAPDGSVDFILTGRNIHNFIWRGDLDKVLTDAFKALRPGGVLAVEEHRADPRPMIKDARDGYVSEAFVIAAARKAGFDYSGDSEINANPRDSKDHPFGVWTLPPTRASAPPGQPPNPNFDHAKYDRIGESDCMTLRFVKPG
ncbi:MAG TPA: methyltransferase [Caulobacteraceae bacterium]|jgi:predicted methyltransferase|nr:methyltransferase [Caulobacteraceae bacterium]